jgi:Zn-dependent protease
MRLLKAGISKEWLAGDWNQLVGIFTYLSILLVAVYPATVVSNGHPGVAAAAGLLVFGYLPICIFVHEIGHAVAAWLVGWRVHLIVVGSRGYAPRGRRFLRASRNGQQKDLGGWVHTTPPPDTAPNKGAITVKLGGAIGNLVLAMLSALAATLLYEVQIHLYAFLLGLGGVSVVYAIRNLVPTWSPGGWQSDGASLIRVLRGVEPSVYDQSFARLWGLVYDNVPVEKWDASLLKAVMDGPEQDREAVDPLLISYSFCVGDLETAKSILERYLGTNPEAPFEHRCMYAFAIVMTDGDASHASEILEALPEAQTRNSFSFWRAKAVTAHLLGRSEQAMEATRKARHFASTDGLQLDEDDESVFGAIEQNLELPHLEPRQQILARDSDSSEIAAGKSAFN